MTTTTTTGAYKQLRGLLRKAATLHSVQSLLAWDQETYMPAGGSEARSEQSADIATIVHQRRTDPRIGELIEQSAEEASHKGSAETRNLELIKRDYERVIKLPEDLVSELARVGSLAQDAWKAARKANDYNAFKPWLAEMMELTRRKAECYGVPEGGELYDALLEEYEPGGRAAEIEQVFAPLAGQLSNLVGELLDSPTPPDSTALGAEVPTDRQHAFGLRMLQGIGFDLRTGRLDVTTHPFCEGLAHGDTRLTTRYRLNSFMDALYGTLHEAGHGLYEQGLPKGERFGEPLGESVSLGIHESQSRLWENFVGRSPQFWQWATPIAHEVLETPITAFGEDQLFAAANHVERSFIRVEADEATYNLHVMLRFELERALIKRDLHLDDLPGVWNERFEQLLGAKVPDDTRGCLQDVHWSFGLIGYFPTYTLGTLYAAQFWKAANEQIPALEDKIARGEFAPLLQWLRDNIHSHGRRYSATELCERITGGPLRPEPLMDYLGAKLRPLYGLS
jgi:carboxypeptidase Taq